MKIYYKIWVSLFLRIKTAQNENENAALILSLIVLTTANIINYYLVCYLFITLFKINLNLIDMMNFGNRYLSIATTVLIFFLPNYFLLVFNQKHEKLLELYMNENKRNFGLYYFVISCLFVVLFVFLTILFPQLFGLIKR
jgi:hypothetical protein